MKLEKWITNPLSGEMMKTIRLYIVILFVSVFLEGPLRGDISAKAENPRTYSLENAVPADKVIFKEEGRFFEIKFDSETPASGFERLVIGDLWSPGGPDAPPSMCRPVVLVKKEGKWLALVFEDQAGQGWVYAGLWEQEGRKEFWGILDYQIEGPGWELIVIRSIDAGQNWRVMGQVKKVNFNALFHDLTMSPKGRGRLTIAMDENLGSVKPGLYHYRTKDWGRTWVAPEYEPNCLSPLWEDNQGTEIHELSKLPEYR